MSKKSKQIAWFFFFSFFENKYYFLSIFCNVVSWQNILKNISIDYIKENNLDVIWLGLTWPQCDISFCVYKKYSKLTDSSEFWEI